MSSHQHHPPLSVSWELKVNISEFAIVEQSLRVTGDLHIGGVIIQLVEKLTPHIRQDWSDFSLWWPDKNMWLSRTKMTLDQYGVQADAVLHFTRIHKRVRIRLPDTQICDYLSVDFAVSVFAAVKQVCKQLGIRNHEELSFLRPRPSDQPKTGHGQVKACKGDESKNGKSANEIEPSENTNRSFSSSSNASTLNNSSPNSFTNKNGKFSRERSQSLSTTDTNESQQQQQVSLALSPVVSTLEYAQKFQPVAKYKTLFDKTPINARWLDSSRSLMEQGVFENDVVELRFKYYAFFDLAGKLKLDAVRLNQIYEQAKWTVLSEEIDCTEPELISFAALQVNFVFYF